MITAKQAFDKTNTEIELRTEMLITHIEGEINEAIKRAEFKISLQGNLYDSVVKILEENSYKVEFTTTHSDYPITIISWDFSHKKDEPKNAK